MKYNLYILPVGGHERVSLQAYAGQHGGAQADDQVFLSISEETVRKAVMNMKSRAQKLIVDKRHIGPLQGVILQ